MDRHKDIALWNLNWAVMPAYTGTDALDNMGPRGRLLALLKTRKAKDANMGKRKR